MKRTNRPASAALGAAASILLLASASPAAPTRFEPTRKELKSAQALAAEVAKTPHVDKSGSMEPMSKGAVDGLLTKLESAYTELTQAKQALFATRAWCKNRKPVEVQLDLVNGLVDAAREELQNGEGYSVKCAAITCLAKSKNAQDKDSKGNASGEAPWVIYNRGLAKADMARKVVEKALATLSVAEMTAVANLALAEKNLVEKSNAKGIQANVAAAAQAAKALENGLRVLGDELGELQKALDAKNDAFDAELKKSGHHSEATNKLWSEALAIEAQIDATTEKYNQVVAALPEIAKKVALLNDVGNENAKVLGEAVADWKSCVGP